MRSSSSSATPPTQQQQLSQSPRWSRLPPELIRCIHSKLEFLSDNIRFRVVCKWWRISTPSGSQRPQSPWLLLAYDVQRCPSRRFYSPAERDVHVLPLPEAARGTRCCGSSLGWLLLLSTTPSVSLLNPITRASIPLPPLTAFPRVAAFHPQGPPGREYVLSDPDRPGALLTASSDDMQKLFLRKAVLSSDPVADPDSLLLALRFNSRKLAFCRVRGDSWAELDVPVAFGLVLDVACHRGRFYLSCSSGRVAVCDVASSDSSAQLSLVTPAILTGCNSYYLVDTPSDDLLLVGRYVQGIYSEWRPGRVTRTTRFRVFKLDLHGEGSGVELDSVGDCLVFLGMNHSICVSAAAAAGGSCGLKAGRIYYVDMNVGKGQLGMYDISAFNVDNGTSELVFRDVHKLNQEWTLTAWVTPNLC